jgi:hypothetical protein
MAPRRAPARPVGPRRGSRALLLAALSAAAGPAWAQPGSSLPPIADRGYDIDLHLGIPFGSPRIVAMGGTTTALSEGATGILGNPAAVAARPLASRETWDWDGTLGGFSPGLGSDFDNNGFEGAHTRGVALGTAGLLGFYERWGLGVGLGGVTYTIAPAEGRQTIDISALVGRVVVGRTFRDETWVLGGGLRFGSLSTGHSGVKDGQLFGVGGGSVEAGVLASPAGRAFRVGARGSLPVHGSDVEAKCDPTNCNGHILPERAVVPWEIAAGVAVRLAPSGGGFRAQPGVRYRDEKAWTLAADVVASGPVRRGAGIEAFAIDRLQRSGRTVALSYRAGAEHELWPSLLRLRAGAYWEPGRFDAVPGRLHLTFGGELKIVAFPLLGAERRLSLSLAGDVARRYGSAGFSLGFWH